MSDIMQFVFSSFWVWLGTVILLSVCINGAFNGVAAIIGAFTGNYPPVSSKKEEN